MNYSKNNAAHTTSGIQSQFDPVFDNYKDNNLEKNKQPLILQQLSPNISIARRFLTWLDEDAEAFTFQTFGEKGELINAGLSHVIHGSLDQHLQYLRELQEKGAGVFLTVNRTDLRGRKKENILEVRAFFVDLDGSPLEPVLNAPVTPHLVVESSPGKYHAYWLVEDCPLEKFTEIQKELAQKFGGDIKVSDLSRVMRLPGFYHQKNEPFQSRITEESASVPIPFEKFVDALNLRKQVEVCSNSEDQIFQMLLNSRMIKREESSRLGCYSIICPWEYNHSSSDLGTKYYLAGHNEYTQPGFKCFHDHCKDKTIKELREFLGLDDMTVSEPLPLHRRFGAPKPFPTDAMGEVLAPASRALKSIIKAPDAVCAQSILSAASLACQAFGNVYIDGRVIPLSLYLITVAESGERKSATDQAALKAVYDWQKIQYDIYRKEVKKYQSELEVWEARKKKFLNEVKNDNRTGLFEEQEPEKPLEPFLLVDEPTYEGVVKLLVNGQPSIGIFSDEGGRFFGGHAMGRDNQLKTISGLSSFWDGKPVSRSRAGDGNLILYGRRVSLHLMIQENILKQLMEDKGIEHQGFLPRCLMAFPASTAGSRPYSDQNVQTSEGLSMFKNRIDKFLDRPFPVDPPPSPQNELNPPRLVLSNKAKLLWINFHNKIDSQLSAGGKWNEVRRFGSKAAEHVLRLAAIMSLITDPDSTVIEEQFIQQAIILVEYYLSEINRIQGYLSIPFEIEIAQKVLDWCHSKEKEKITLRELYQSGPKEIRSAKKAREIMKILEDHRWAIKDDKSRDRWSIRKKSK